MGDRDKRCVVCDLPIEAGKQWIVLNRYVMGTGRNRGMIVGKNENGECLWKIAENMEDERASGVLLHWPACFPLFVEAKMAEIDFLTSRGFTNG